MKYSKNDNHKPRVVIYHHELDLQYENNTSYLMFTEIQNNLPVRTYYYRIPAEFYISSMVEQILERFYQYCPN